MTSIKGKRIIFLAFSVILMLTAVLVLPEACSALAEEDLGVEHGRSIGLGEADPRVVATNIIRVVLGFLGILAVALIIYGGFLWMTSNGNEEQIAKAKKVLSSAIIGLLIILASFAIASFVLSRLLDATGAGSGESSDPGPGGPGPGGSPAVSCDSNDIMPGCQPGDCPLSGQTCDQITCQCRSGGAGTPCDSATSTSGCQPDNNLCAPGYICSSTAGCVCQSLEGGGQGDDCNATSTAGVCSPDQEKCSYGYECSSLDCVCENVPIVEWISPVGGFCENDPDQACLSDSDCSTACSTSTPNGAPGNIISIGGRHFGDSAGEVRFYDGNGFNAVGESPVSLNPECDSGWSSDQIIIVVPAGARTGPIRIVRSDSEYDDTNDDTGPLIEDFTINDISKPGLCHISRDQAPFGAELRYDGVNLSGAEARFGGYSEFVTGGNQDFAGTVSGRAEVPDLRSGDTTTFVSGPEGMNSNYLRFEIVSQTSTGPFISDFEPDTGASGQYLTIKGGGFGPSRSGSKVYFGSKESGFEANYMFPDVCADSVWQEDQIIVKVPEGIPNGEYILSVYLGDEMVNTGDLSDNIFEVDDNLSLLPSLCKIKPVIGQPGDKISLWGEYFGEQDTNSKVRFYRDRDVSGANIEFWDADFDESAVNRPDKVEVFVHQEAITGPVSIVKGMPELEGNSMDFSVGACLEAADPDQACGSLQICCPEGSYKAGRCQDDISDCSMDIPSSVYEWEFNTGFGTTSSESEYGSCFEMSRETGSCSPDICPNSPGQCSFKQNSSDVVAGECDFDCSSSEVCSSTSAGCSYDASLDSCLDNDQTSCSLASSTNDALGRRIDAECIEYEGNSIMAMYVAEEVSCLSGWKKELVGEEGVAVCINEKEPCSLCNEGFDCIDDNDQDLEGVCSDGSDVCPDSSVCESDGFCRKTEEAVCECCCRKNNDDQDCCVDLECMGACGAETADDNPNLGLCSGCRVDLDGDKETVTPAEQQASDEACNCSHTNNKYCDVNAGPLDEDGIPMGVCQDCAQLSSPEACSAHSGTCCVDAMNNDNCRGYLAAGADGIDGNEDDEQVVSNNGLEYCGYFECADEDNAEPFSGNPVWEPRAEGVKYYQTRASSTFGCVGDSSGLGIGCVSSTAETCDQSDCSFDCINSDGSGSSYPDCGVCCCQPGSGQCESLNPDFDGLSCQPDNSPCTGDSRGLCCGCSEDEDCNSSPGDYTLGCGNDTCCRQRAEVNKTMPGDGDDGVCANTSIIAEFNQKMDVSSFVGNFILLGEYDKPCPEGTQYLASAGKGQKDKNFIIRNIYKIYEHLTRPIAKIFGGQALASDPPSNAYNYCAVSGSVSGYHQGGSTEMIFNPSKLLDTNTRYYAIAKGDDDFSDVLREGILDLWDNGFDGGNSPVDNTAAFNGLTYGNSYIWSFKTMDDQGASGICEIEKVDLRPDSYLFSKSEDDLGENDEYGTATYDTKADNDKVFIAKALTADGQILSPVEGAYSWSWDWIIENDSVIDYDLKDQQIPAAKDGQVLLEAQSGITDAKTDLTAEVNIDDNPYGLSGDGVSDVSDVQVFICDNPWPPVRSDGNWYPWIDEENNCNSDLQGNSCHNYNYELYYCRDSGQEGTVDDLPALMSDDAVIIGSSNDTLKESFFFREKAPGISGSSLEISKVSSGQALEFYWDEASAPEGEIISGYNLYYGTESGPPFNDSMRIETDEAPYSTGQGIVVEGLNNGQDYYFALTSVTEDGAESDYIYPEKENYPISPSDEEAPPRVNNVSASTNSVWYNIISDIEAGFDEESREGSIRVGWRVDNKSGSVGEIDWQGGTYADVQDRLDSMVLYYGQEEGKNYADNISINAARALSNKEGIKVDGLATGTPYYLYFLVDYSDNEGSSLPSSEASITIPEEGVDRTMTSVRINISDSVTVSWRNSGGDTAGYKVYYGTKHASYGEVIEVDGATSTEASFPINNSNSMYFIKVTAVDEAGNESSDSDEIVVVPGRTNSIFKNALTNVSFENGSPGGMPPGWRAFNGRKAFTSIDDSHSFSGSQCLRIFQEPGIPYPGKCGQALAEGRAPMYDEYPYSHRFVWDGSRCDFDDQTYYCGRDCIFNSGQNLRWPYTNKVMRTGFTYNVSGLDWEVGEEYLIAFYYKGRLARSIRPQIAYSLTWSGQCLHNNNNRCERTGGWEVCRDNSRKCCRYTNIDPSTGEPYQTNCYGRLSLADIPAGEHAGDYSGWNLYFSTFEYTETLDGLRDNSGRLHNLAGLRIGYNSTGAGTDFYVDDFIIAQKDL